MRRESYIESVCSALRAAAFGEASPEGFALNGHRTRFAQVVVGLVGFVSVLDSGVAGLIIQPIKHDLGLTDVQVGLAYGTAFYAAYGLFAIPGGMLADKVPRVRLLVFAMILLCAGLLITALSQGIWMLVFSKALVGVSAAFTYPAALSLLADLFPPETRSSGSICYPIGQQLGTFAAFLGGGLGYSALVRLRINHSNVLHGLAPWRVLSLAFSVLGLLVVPFLIELPEPQRMERGGDKSGTLRELWSYRRLLAPLFVGIMCLAGASSGILTWLAPSLTRLYHLQPGDYAAASSVLILTCGLSAFILAGKVANYVQERWGSRAVSLAAAVATVLCVPGMLAGLMPTPIGFAAMGSTYEFFIAMAIWLPTMTINLRIPNELRGLCMGSYVVLIGVAGMIGSPLVGYASNALGGQQMIGRAIPAVCVPFAILAAFSFWLAAHLQSADIVDERCGDINLPLKA